MNWIAEPGCELRLSSIGFLSLNASFETLSAYHGWKKRNTPENRIDTASRNDPLLRKAAARFYQ